MAPVSIGEIKAAREHIHGVVLTTPLHPFLGREIPNGNRLWLKAENLQRTGSFKLRGAYNAVAGLDEASRSRGVITYSSGNHGQAVACAASLLGVRAVVVMPEDAIGLKVEATRRWGADVIFAGHTSLDRQAAAMDLVDQHGYAVIPPFDDVRIVAGQGTTGLEILDAMPDVETIVVQIGGGGLISGIATAIKAVRPDIAVIGVEPEGAADAHDSFHRRELVTWDRIETIADGLRTSRIGALNFQTIMETVDDVVTVSEAEIMQTVGILAIEAKLVAEPSGAVATAAVLHGRLRKTDSRTVAVISGGNVEPSYLRACIDSAAERVPAHR